MQTKSKIYRLKGVVQHYNWGGHDFLPEFLRLENPSGQPCAEYWMGAHQKAPSQVIFQDGSQQPMDTFIKERAKEVLGEAVNNDFGRLPYLFKILDVKNMLSIQVHPSKEAALMEFAAEEKKGIPMDAPDRNYKDDNYKPELMFALSDFWLLHGFKPPAALEGVLKSIPELNFLQPVWKESGYEGIYRQVMQMDQEMVNIILQPLIDRVLPLYNKNKLEKSGEDFWAARAYKTFCKEGMIDRGLFSIYFFNIVNLKPGEAIFQDAGILHAYLEGQNLEIMANSDNVLRGGLTNKKIDVPELLRHVRFVPVVPEVLKGQPVNNTQEEAFKTPAVDFELRRTILEPGTVIELECNTVDIFLITAGFAEARSDGISIALKKGECLFGIKGASIKVHSGQEGAVVFRATVPG